MRATSSTLFVRVNTEVTWKRGNGKRETVEKWHWKIRNRYALLISTFNKNIWHTSGPSIPKTINSALRHQCRYVIQFKIRVIILMTTMSTVLALQINRRASVTPHITFLVVYSATGITNWATRQTWLDCFFGFVSLAIQRLPYFYSHIFQFRVFQCRVFYFRAISGSASP